MHPNFWKIRNIPRRNEKRDGKNDGKSQAILAILAKNVSAKKKD
jgi:hypothetical protein